jgi:hypothetical protein
LLKTRTTCSPLWRIPEQSTCRCISAPCQIAIAHTCSANIAALMKWAPLSRMVRPSSAVKANRWVYGSRPYHNTRLDQEGGERGNGPAHRDRGPFLRLRPILCSGKEPLMECHSGVACRYDRCAPSDPGVRGCWPGAVGDGSARPTIPH